MLRNSVVVFLNGLYMAVSLICHSTEGIPESSNDVDTPVIAPECPFFKARDPKILGPKTNEGFTLITSQLNFSRGFEEEAYFSHDAVQGRVVKYRRGNATVGAKGSCLTCGNTCSSCDVTLAVGGFFEPGVIDYVLPLHYYEVQLTCVLKHKTAVLTYRAIPDKITLVTTCDFPHIRPSSMEYLFIGAVAALEPRFFFELKYAYQLSAERTEKLRQLCGFQSPMISQNLDEYDQCLTYGTDPESNCKTIGAAPAFYSPLKICVFLTITTLYIL